jgi:D-sedoheptulose 7-phosphate isomerase
LKFIYDYFEEVELITKSIDAKCIDLIIKELVKLKKRNGRLFILGVGGSAGNSSHAVNDFRKLTGIESYAPTDNVSEITARTNDEGWDTIFSFCSIKLRSSAREDPDLILKLLVLIIF